LRTYFLFLVVVYLHNAIRHVKSDHVKIVFVLKAKKRLKFVNHNGIIYWTSLVTRIQIFLRHKLS
jgi:hypothetical protein